MKVLWKISVLGNERTSILLTGFQHYYYVYFVDSGLTLVFINLTWIRESLMLRESHFSGFKATLSLLLPECCWNDDIKYPTLSHTTSISLYVSLLVYIKTITVIKARLVDLPMNFRESSIGEVTTFVWKI